jgi:hypothetical protein
VAVPPRAGRRAADAWQLRNELGYTADADRVNAHAADADADHLALLRAGAAAGRGHGAFLHSCSTHLGHWRLNIGGVDMCTAVGLWVASLLASGSPTSQATQSNGTAEPMAVVVAATDFGSGGNLELPFLWVQNRTYPCPDCCEVQQQPLLPQLPPRLGQAVDDSQPGSVYAE